MKTYAKVLSPVIAVLMVIALMVAVVPAFAAETFRIAGATLELKSDLSIKYYVTVPDSYTDVAAEFTLDGKKTTVTAYETSGSYKVFTFSNIAPQYMGTDITTVVRAKNGGSDVATAANTYSVLTYCNNTLGKTEDAALKRLIVDLLNYGAASQTYVGYNTSSLANAGLTPAQKALGTQAPRQFENKQASSGTAGSATIAGATLVLNKSIDINIYITASSMTGLKLKVAKDGEQVALIDSFTVSGNYNIALFNKLNPSNLSDVYEFTVVNASGSAVSKTISYSVESYAARTLENSTDENLRYLVAYMMNYGDSAYYYVYGEEVVPATGLILSTDDPADNPAMVIDYSDLFK